MTAVHGFDRLEALTIRDNVSDKTEKAPANAVFLFAGDVRNNGVRRVASAVGQRAVAVSMVHKYLETA